MILPTPTHEHAAVQPEIFAAIPDVPGDIRPGIVPRSHNYLSDIFEIAGQDSQQDVNTEVQQDGLCPGGVCEFEPVEVTSGGEKTYFDQNGHQIPSGNYNPQVGNTYNEQIFNQGARPDNSPTTLVNGEQVPVAVPQTIRVNSQHHYRNGVDQNQTAIYTTHPYGTLIYSGSVLPDSARKPGVVPFSKQGLLIK